MMNNNKILTVSYGTFSCTLEGFDDSFGTMKAIAEYFRDLAADDRYFGAEPPQPDAEMLARIAQKEVSRRVEAREQDGKIVLSALEGGAKTVPSIADAAITASPEATAADSEAQLPTEVEEVSAQAIVETEETVEVATAPMANGSAELADDAIPVIEEVLEEAEVPTVELAQHSAEPLDAVAVDELTSDVEFVEDENDIVPGQADAEVGAFFAESEEAVTDAPTSTPKAPVTDAPEPDSIAAKLQRIRAVVAQQEEAAEEDDYLEDEHAEAAETLASAESKSAQPADIPVADAIADIQGALDADDKTAFQELEEKAEDDADDVSAILSRLGADSEPDSAPEPTVDANLYDEVEDEGPSVEDTVSNLFDENEATLAQTNQAPAAPRVSLRKTSRVAPEAEPTQEAAEEQKVASRARVIKVKRADLEAAIEKGDLEEYGEEEGAASADPSPVDAPQSRKLDDLAPARRRRTALSPEAEDELTRELAQLEDDISSSEDAVPTPSRRPTVSARNVLPSIDEGNGTAVNRLLAETDHQMDEPESATRRDAFAHLRAAVAAKKADVAMGDKTVSEESDDAYRNDLAEVVRPRRPASASARTERPTEAEPAPLKLVAEQRIDVEKEPVAGPVRPRRVSASMTDEASEMPDGESFSEFAADMGASTLPQLLEAAAAYMSFVEGREQFSRPQLMTKVRQAGGQEEFSREEGLRSFGQLLRAGKIEKIKGGRFTVSDDIGYRPDQRAAG